MLEASTRIVLVVTVAAWLLPDRAEAAAPSRHRIDPLLRDAPAGAPADPELAAIVRVPDLDTAQQAALEADGVRFRRAPDGRTRHLGPLYPVHATRATLARLAGLGFSVQVSRPLAIEPTLYATAIETQSFELAGHAETPTQGPIGRRVTLGTFEPGLDIFHPHFFRADGGAWPWVDVDDDGAFTAGIDGVDANLDGEIEPTETLRLLDYGFNVGNALHGYDDAFQTAYDYLYLDMNDDGGRDFGVMNGYSEASPGYGEPMFMPDDADGDGELSPDERIVLLATSQVAGFRALGQVWTRGVDLIETPPDVTFDLNNGSHGTSTMGIMTGGQTHPFRANRGHVADADIAVVSYYSADTLFDDFVIESLSWLGQDMDAVVVNHSWARRGSRLHLDGSNVIDTGIDAASADGSMQVCAAGNGREVGKHRETTTIDGIAAFTASLPGSVFGIAPREITFDLHWPAAAGSFVCTVTRPGGSTYVVQEVPDGVFEDLVVDAFRHDSDRGMALLSIQITHSADGPVGSGAWQFSCEHDGTDEIVVHALVNEGITISQDGVSFVDATQTSTLFSPGTADACITVAGYPIQYSQYGSALGDLEPYSSMGPRYDGEKTVDIAAPVDAVAPTIDPDHDNAYTAFSGTSGATPQVSGIVGLMKVLDPELDAQEIRQRIRDAGAVDVHVGDVDLPDPGWGHGKLRGYEAFVGEAPPPRPRIRGIDLDIAYAYDDGECAATITVEGVDWDDASFRWDFEYDGTWDTEFEAEASRTRRFAEEGETFQVRVDAAERGYIVAGTVATDEVPASCFVPPAGDTSSGSAADETSDAEPDTGDDDDDDDDGTTDGGTAAQSDGEDGCGCTHSRPSLVGLLAPVLLALVRRRRRA